MKKKLPTTVKIGGLVFKIKYITPGKGKPLEYADAGCIIMSEQIIYIDKDLSYDVSLIVILHEILHGIGDVYRPNKNAFIKEEFTSTVSHLLFQALTSAKLLR